MSKLFEQTIAERSCRNDHQLQACHDYGVYASMKVSKSYDNYMNNSQSNMCNAAGLLRRGQAVPMEASARNYRQIGPRELSYNTQSRIKLTTLSGYDTARDMNISGLAVLAAAAAAAAARNVRTHRVFERRESPAILFQDNSNASSNCKYNHEDCYNIASVARRPTLFPNNMMLPELHQGPHLIELSTSCSDHLPYPVDSSNSFVRKIKPNLDWYRTRNTMPIFQEQEQIEDDLRRMHPDGSSCSPHEQRRVEDSLSPPQPQASLYRLNYNEKRGRKGVCFNSRLTCLIEFRKEHGHCNVPTCTRKKDRSNKYYNLGVWCGNVRKAYKRMQQNKKPALRLKDEDIQRLDEIGFRWQQKRTRSLSTT